MRILLSRNFAYARFRENKTLGNISKFTVLSREGITLRYAGLFARLLFTYKNGHFLVNTYFSNDMFLCFAAMELSILMKSLATKTTRDYFATFEREHKCFIDVQKKDNQRTTSTKVLRYFTLI